ncbi:MAG TPA: O-antigen polysaccharide polymerase Wzy [Vicinamibacterales bacterium]|nr:O-antigen polysaccharide polymerase Wzy [Vicinamibacterales bacterium]
MSPILISRSGDIVAVIAGQDPANEALIRSYLALQVILLGLFAVWTSRVSGTLLSAPFLLAASLFLWHFSFVVGFFLYGEDIFSYPGGVFDIGREQVEAAIGFCGLCFSCLMIGVLYAYYFRIVLRRRHPRPARPAPPPGADERFAVYAHRVGVVGLIACTLVLLAFDVLENRASGAVSYSDLYLQTSGAFIYRLFYATQYFGAVFVLMALARPAQDRPVLPAVVAALVLVFLHFLNGSRSLPFIVFVAFVVCYDTSFRRLSAPIIATVGIGMSAASWIVSQARDSGVGLHVFTLTTASVNLLHFLWESGRSIGAVIMTFHFVGQEPYRYGASFLESALELVPLTSRFARSVVPVERPSEWLLARVATVPQGKGFGYSLVAEAFFNFGYAGCLLFVLLGAFVGRYYFGYLKTGSTYLFLMASSVAVMLSLHMRNDSGSFLRTLLISFIMFHVLKRVSERAQRGCGGEFSF